MVGASIWIAFSLGVMFLACGGVLLGCSLAAGRQELWNVGLPIALVGQIALLAGLLLQLDRLWHHHRQTVATLDRVDHHLRELQGTKGHPTLGRGVSIHPAHEPSPTARLSQIKSQLELLAARLAEAEKR